MSNNNILLCDIGGTHARFARYVKRGAYDNFKKYRLRKFITFKDVIQNYLDDVSLNFDQACFSTSGVPIDDVIDYKRFEGDDHFKIEFIPLAKHFKWKKWQQKMDSQAGGLGLSVLSDNIASPIIPAKSMPINSKKILIAVGTGIYHALVNGHDVSTQTDGHYLPVTVTDEQRAVEKFIRKKKNPNLSLIMEDFVSARGLRHIAEYTSTFSNFDLSPEDFMVDLKRNPEAVRIFYEFLGLYVHMITTITGHYGGVYLTGGVIDHLIKNDLSNWDAFEKYCRPPMLPVVNNRLSGISVSHILHDELPLLGLTTLQGMEL